MDSELVEVVAFELLGGGGGVGKFQEERKIIFALPTYHTSLYFYLLNANAF